ncbi:MAG: tRNA (guanine-N1)-methyltransferase [Deltaproteobacteria bacterium]|nr:tRNA (guanine-N1)-methyltransferase [Deltaproteobacteria bacterium]
MKFTVVTILPEIIDQTLGGPPQGGPLAHGGFGPQDADRNRSTGSGPAGAAGVVGRAREAGTITVATINPRDFTTDRHRSVDDTPYGGGPGMVMKPEPLLAAIAACGPAHRILLSPAGTPLTQARVRELAKLPHLVLVCGRYEGIDQRVIDLAIDEELSIGDYVLSGGELGALVVIDAVARLVPGVLGEATSADDESHSAGLLEYPQYTRPPKLPASSEAGEDHEVPGVLLSGNHAAIAAWRRRQSIERTARRRPDLFARFVPSAADRKLISPLQARTHLALVHHPVVDRTGKVVTSALTNFDIHDLARSTLTYGLAAYHIVTPVTSQREKAQHIASLWLETRAESTESAARKPPVSGSRASALALVRTADSIETVLAELTAEYGMPPIVVATSARAESFPHAARRTPEQLRAEATLDPAPLLVMLGTGWGLADALIPSVSRVLAPIEGASDWNHLSVRSAAAILLDRLFGRSP